MTSRYENMLKYELEQAKSRIAKLEEELETAYRLIQHYEFIHDYLNDGVLGRYGFLVGDPGRSPAEEAEMQELRAILIKQGRDPGWEPVPINPELVELEDYK